MERDSYPLFELEHRAACCRHRAHEIAAAIVDLDDPVEFVQARIALHGMFELAEAFAAEAATMAPESAVVARRAASRMAERVAGMASQSRPRRRHRMLAAVAPVEHQGDGSTFSR